MQRVRKLVEGNIPGMPDGSGVTIAVLDTGVGGHPDLAGSLLCFRDFVENRRMVYDSNGHGTHVCGILCGDGRMSAGRYRGMAPGARLVVGKVLDQKGEGTVEAMLEGIGWILEIRGKYGIRILNISVGIGDLKEKRKERALHEKLGEVWDSGILVVCAAGNKGPGDGTISGVGGNKVVTVGCYDGDCVRNNPERCEVYSGRGIPGNPLRKPDLVAPGTDIISCNAFCRGRWDGGSVYVAKSGTSMAAPIVSGAAALLFQKYPHMTNEECKQKLQFSAVDMGLPWNQQGWGMLNVGRLLS